MHQKGRPRNNHQSSIFDSDIVSSGKLETMEDDVNYVLHHVPKTNFTYHDLFDMNTSPHSARVHGKETRDVIAYYFKNVSRPILDKYLRAIDVDSRMFDYGSMIGWNP